MRLARVEEVIRTRYCSLDISDTEKPNNLTSDSSERN